MIFLCSPATMIMTARRIRRIAGHIVVIGTAYGGNLIHCDTIYLLLLQPILLTVGGHGQGSAQKVGSFRKLLY